MKKTFFIAACALVLTSCSGEDKKDEKKDEKSGPSLCECVNQGSDQTEDCKKMEKEWREKFQNASEEEKEKMMEEIKACENQK